MKRKILIPILVVLLVGLVGAGIGIGAYNESRELGKTQRDELLSQTDAKDISPNITITCNDDYCLWSATQDGIISSYNNRINRYWNGTENPVAYTDAEIQDLVADAVLSRLENYADASIQRKANVQEDWGTGNLEITEKK